MEFIYEYGLFLAQAITFVVALLVVVAGLVAIGQRQKAEQHEGHIEIRNLKSEIIDACPAVNTEEFRQNASAHRFCDPN